MKPPKKPAAPKVAQTMIEAERLTGISKIIQLAAKRAGCSAFIGQRIHLEPLKKWVKSHRQLVIEAVHAGDQQSRAADLKRRKLIGQIEGLEAKNKAARESLISKELAADVWTVLAALVMGEAVKALADYDLSRIFRERCNSRLASQNLSPLPEP